MSSDNVGAPLVGQNLICGEWIAGQGVKFHAHDPRTGAELPTAFQSASPAEIAAACDTAASAFPYTRSSADADRADLLDDVAGRLERASPRVIEQAALESGLVHVRLQGEMARTVGQLRMFADAARQGAWRRPVVDVAVATREPTPRPELRRAMVPLGPIAVFAASNFPLAFSVAGGDTASALAVGCPVIVKAHESHPGTSELVAAIISEGLAASPLPAGAFSMVHGDGRDVARCLVTNRHVAGVAFTGSQQGGMAICELARQRPRPVPVFAEMSSLNPVFVLPHALRHAGQRIGAELARSVTLGNGQFCTKPGVIFGVAGMEWATFGETLAAAAGAATLGPMLNERVSTAYVAACAARVRHPGVEVLLSGDGAHLGGSQVGATVLRTTYEAYASGDFEAEVFGPSTILVTCPDVTTLLSVVDQLGGQLTATIHRHANDDAVASPLIEALTHVAGRVVVDGVPTGVEVVGAMQHGGPYPATTDSRFTSVGTEACARFVRPVCVQNVPPHLLPTSHRASE